MKTNSLAETMDQAPGAVLRTLLPVDEVDQSPPRLEIFTFSDKVKPLNLTLQGPTRAAVDEDFEQEGLPTDPFETESQPEVPEAPASKGPSFFGRMLAKLKFSGKKDRGHPAGLGLS